MNPPKAGSYAALTVQHIAYWRKSVRNWCAIEYKCAIEYQNPADAAFARKKRMNALRQLRALYATMREQIQAL